MSRNPIAYKWKAPFRVWMLREAVFWRFQDLMQQSFALHQMEHALGARILLRSGLETLATLIYLNQLMQQVLDGQLNFFVFAEKTSALLLGRRNNVVGPKSLNIITILEKCDKRYPGLTTVYADLSESAHPSHEGLCMGYSRIDHEEYVTNFSNRWTELYEAKHLIRMNTCMETFDHEYNKVWTNLMEKLEGWLVTNDSALEATKPG